MSTEILRDRRGIMIGKIVLFGGRYFIYDPDGNRLGHYDLKINATFDASGNRVGYGNLLTLLLGR